MEHFSEGQKIGSCVYISDAGSKIIGSQKRRCATFRCKCGKEFTSTISKVKIGHTSSCGCAHQKFISNLTLRHGMSNSDEFKIWSKIIERTNPKHSNNPRFRNYSAIGISVCERWRNSFENFLTDMGRRPSKEYSIDRHPNKRGNYCPENCRWATKKEQANNTRTNVEIEYNGKTKTLTEWCDELNIPYGRVKARIRRYNWDIKKAFENN